MHTVLSEGHTKYACPPYDFVWGLDESYFCLYMANYVEPTLFLKPFWGYMNYHMAPQLTKPPLVCGERFLQGDLGRFCVRMHSAWPKLVPWLWSATVEKVFCMKILSGVQVCLRFQNISSLGILFVSWLLKRAYLNGIIVCQEVVSGPCSLLSWVLKIGASSISLQFALT